MPRILIAGDVNPCGVNETAFRVGDAAAILGDLLPEFEKADLAIANLETPLISEAAPITKSGPVLGVSDKCIAGLSAIGFGVLGLANNHTMDHGDSGLQNTLSVCSKAGIGCVGAGSDLKSAGKIHVWQGDDHRVGILALAEHEFGIATRSKSGVCPMDPVVFSRAILAQRSNYDSLVVLIHGGNEYYRYPRPSLQQLCRYLVELGADIVVCQHSHIVGCYEQYRNGHILYGQGNFICEGVGRESSWNEGLLVVADLKKNSPTTMSTIALVQSENGVAGARRMQGEQLACFQAEFEKRCAETGDPAVVESRWDAFCTERREEYLRRYGALHRAFRLLDKLTGYIRFLLGRRRMRLDHLNLVRCESHREVIINLLERE